MIRFVPFIAGIAAGVQLVRERRARRAEERFAAAAMETLLNAIDANDPQTGAHLRRVARYALLLAEAAELDEHRQRSVERIALFHDIGKIHAALYDIIHFNDDPLTPEERRTINAHPRRGAEVLAPLAAFYPDLPEGVLSHHERWNGTGYPRGLKGRRIPLEARIVSIADSFDAITEARRYKLEQSPDEAAAAIARGRGTQFDPELVDLFLFPPIFERVMAEYHAARRRTPRRSERRVGEQEPDVPDVTFRWRDEGPALPPRDPALRESP